MMFKRGSGRLAVPSHGPTLRFSHQPIDHPANAADRIGLGEAGDGLQVLRQNAAILIAGAEGEGDAAAEELLPVLDRKSVV